MEEEYHSKLVSKLIYEVSQKPILYDSQHALYKDNTSRTKAWKRIAEKLQMPIADCQIKWGTLRRCLANARKRQMRRQAAGSRNIKKWRYQDEMSFLLPFIDHKEYDYMGSKRQKLQVIRDDRNPQEMFISEEYEQNDIDENTSEIKPTVDNLHMYLVENSSDTNITSNSENLRRYLEKGERLDSQELSEEVYKEVDGEVLVDRYDESSELEWNTSYSSKSRSHIDRSKPKSHYSKDVSPFEFLDEMDTFFLSMSKTLKKLPEAEQINVRSQVYNAVTQAEINWLEKSADSNSSTVVDVTV